MDTSIDINIHTTYDTKVTVDAYPGFVVLRIGGNVSLFIKDETFLGELAQGVDVASKELMPN